MKMSTAFIQKRKKERKKERKGGKKKTMIFRFSGFFHIKR